MTSIEGSSDVGTRVIRLVGVVIADFEFTSQYHDELVRELRLMQVGDVADRRLEELTTALISEFSDFSPAIREAVEDAARQGLTRIDIDVRVPMNVRSWLLRFRDHFREIDAFCDAGMLLSLGSPRTAVAFREWFLGQFIEQLEGMPPTPYS